MFSGIDAGDRDALQVIDRSAVEWVDKESGREVIRIGGCRGGRAAVQGVQFPGAGL